MNFLCHAMPYLDQPLLAVSTGIPDWLSVVDRKIRARRKLAAPHRRSDDPALRQVATGVIRHIDDDDWFHNTAAFAQTNLQLAVELRDRLPGDTGFRPMFVGHVLVEVLLDACLIRQDPTLAKRYYDAVAAVDAATVQRCVNTITGKPTDQLAGLIGRFGEAKFLYDYLDPTALLMRLNQVMRRVKLAPLPDDLVHWLPEAANLVESRRQPLLTPPNGHSPYPL